MGGQDEKAYTLFFSMHVLFYIIDLFLFAHWVILFAHLVEYMCSLQLVMRVPFFYGKIVLLAAIDQLVSS